MGVMVGWTRATSVVDAVAVFAVGWWVARGWEVEVAISPRESVIAGVDSYTPQSPTAYGSQWVMVFVGSPHHDRTATCASADRNAVTEKLARRCHFDRLP